ncbi:MAG: hypothetical protein K0U98_16775 [Deltaproteobacteria bacterium]|nr:hypothetical protein [Deltaproteobacteria bacterium]
MATVDQATLEELLLREMDELLTPQELRLLEESVEHSSELCEERRSFQALTAAMGESRISVRQDFQEQVMANLPVAPWESPARSSWRVPLACLAVLAVATSLLSLWGAQSSATGSLLGSVVAAFDLMKMALVTGAGLLGASWVGLRVAMRELFQASPMALVGVIFLLVGLNALFWLALRRSPVRDRAGSEGPEGEE